MEFPNVCFGGGERRERLHKLDALFQLLNLARELLVRKLAVGVHLVFELAHK